MNAINVIIPYRWEGMWVFGDSRVGLDKEPFVAGADDIIDLFVADIPGAAEGFRLIFAASPFPGYTRRDIHLATLTVKLPPMEQVVSTLSRAIREA